MNDGLVISPVFSQLSTRRLCLLGVGTKQTRSRGTSWLVEQPDTSPRNHVFSSVCREFFPVSFSLRDGWQGCENPSLQHRKGKGCVINTRWVYHWPWTVGPENNPVFAECVSGKHWRLWANSPQPGNADANVTFYCHSKPKVTFAFAFP